MRSTAVGASSSLVMRSRLLADVDVLFESGDTGCPGDPGWYGAGGMVGAAAVRAAPRTAANMEVLKTIVA